MKKVFHILIALGLAIFLAGSGRPAVLDLRHDLAQEEKERVTS